MSKQYISDQLDKKLRQFLKENEEHIRTDNKAYFIKKFYEENTPKENITPTQKLTIDICKEKISSLK